MKTQNLIFFCCFRKVPEGSRTARPAALRPGRGGQSSGLSARARESPFRRTTTALSELSFLGSDNCFYTVFPLMIRQKAGVDDFSFGSVRPGFLCARIACAAAVQTICDGNAVEMRTF